MARSEHKIVIYECDRCGFGLDGDVIRRDEQIACGPSPRQFSVLRVTGERNWVAVISDVHGPNIWLCAGCRQKLNLFLGGRELMETDS